MKTKSIFSFLLILSVYASHTMLYAATNEQYSGTDGGNLSWTLSNDTLVISGSGPMTDFAYYESAPWYAYHEQIKTVSMEEGVTSIGDYAFWGFQDMESLSIPKSIEVIGKNSIEDCFSLTSIAIPENVEFIGYDALHNCTSLVYIEWLAKDCKFNDNGMSPLFSDNLDMTTMVIGADVVSLPDFFCESSSRMTLVCYAANPPAITSRTFERLDHNLAVLCVPKESLDTYKTTTLWKDFPYIYSIQERVVVDEKIVEKEVVVEKEVIVEDTVYVEVPFEKPDDTDHVDDLNIVEIFEHPDCRIYTMSGYDVTAWRHHLPAGVYAITFSGLAGKIVVRGDGDIMFSLTIGIKASEK